MQIRPLSAVQSNSRSKIHFNQQFGYFYRNNQQGGEIKVNKLGELQPKFVDNFSGFVNFRQRKNKSLKDKSLMYSQPNLNYNKQENAIHPKGSKLLGYAQYPFNLKGSVPEFLQSETYKQSRQARKGKNQLKKSGLQRQNSIRYSQNIQGRNKEYTGYGRRLKTLQNCSNNFVSFDEISENKPVEALKLSVYSAQKQNKYEKSVIMDASARYNTAQRLNTAPHNKSSISFSSSNLSNQFVRSNHSNRVTSYFQQSLLNIQKTQTPNFSYELSSEKMTTSICTASSSFLYNQASINSKCYKSSCHDHQYIPKRRYLKKNQEDNTVCMNDYKKQLEVESKEIQIVNKLKDSLKIYQPKKKEQHQKNVAKDKNKANSSQGSSNKVKK